MRHGFLGIGKACGNIKVQEIRKAFREKILVKNYRTEQGTVMKNVVAPWS